MATRTGHVATYPREIEHVRVRSEPAHHAFVILRIGYAILPILAGLDKFFDRLVDWDQYLSGFVNGLVGGHGHQFMLAVGAIEIIAGLGVLIKPRIFAWVVAFWLWGIIVNLLLVPGFFDVALRDFGLSLGAIALAQLSREFNR